MLTNKAIQAKAQYLSMFYCKGVINLKIVTMRTVKYKASFVIRYFFSALSTLNTLVTSITCSLFTYLKHGNGIFMTYTTKPRIVTPAHHHGVNTVHEHHHRALVHVREHGVATRNHHLHPSSDLVHHHHTIASFVPRDHHSLQHHNAHPDQSHHQII